MVFFNSVCINLKKFINFGLGTVWSEKVKSQFSLFINPYYERLQLGKNGN